MKGQSTKGLAPSSGAERLGTKVIRCLAAAAWLYSGCVLASGARWFVRRFGRVDYEQVLFHLEQPVGGLVRIEPGLLHNAVRNVLYAPVAYAILVGAAWWLAGWLMRKVWPGPFAAKLPRPVAMGLLWIAVAAWSVHHVLLFSATGPQDHDWIAELAAPPLALAPPAKRPNLVLIYAESLEDTYRSARLGGDLLAELDAPSMAGQTFSGFTQEHGTGWTIAGIVSSQCGLPLKPVGVIGGNWVGTAMPAFLPGARCLGDVLKAGGWHNVFLGGASPDFAGKGRFLEAHGYDEVLGQEHWLALDPGAPREGWGVDDDYLLDRALEELRELHAAGRPFNLTVLTNGMHPPRGYVAAACEGNGVQQGVGDQRDSVRCTAHLLRRFVERAKAEGLLAGTQVVITGDHLTQQSDLTPLLEQQPHRHVFNRFIPAPAKPKNREAITHFDLYPTILAALGYAVPGGRLGLGCTAIGKSRCRSLAADPQADAKLAAHSPFYDGLWVQPDVHAAAAVRH